MQLTQACAGTSDVITAPAGFSTYAWTYATNAAGTTTTTVTTSNPTNSITINTVYNNTTLTCVCTAVTGCTFTFSIVLNISIPQFTPSSPTVCSGDTATVTASPPTYNYSWSTGATGATIAVAPTANATYMVTASIIGGCSNTNSVVVKVNPLPTGATSFVAATCGQNNGSITVTPATGTAPYTYLWSASAQTTQTATGLGQGTYTVTVTDANGCSAPVTGPVNSNAQVTLTTSHTDETCGKSNGTAMVTASSGSGIYTYIWSSGQTTASITGLAAGTYSVTVSDGVCPQTTSVTLINWPNPKVSITNVIPETCSKSNGGATAVASGGTGAITYLWNPSGQTTAVLSGVAASTYTVTVTDSKGCTADTSVVIKNFPPPTASITNIVPSTCSVANGSITVTPSGGTGAYTYSWSPSAQTTPTASNILGGVTAYTVTVTDSVGCTAITSGVVPNSPGPNITGTTADETCTGLSNGSVTINVTGGVTPLTYIWSNSATTQNITGVIGGTYTVSVSDVNGCSNSKSFVVPTHPLVSATATSMPEYCNKQNGSATVIGSQGDGGPYTFLWSNSQTSATITNLATGTYTVSVTDGHCATTTSVVVNFVQGPTAKIINAVPAKCGLPNGSATVLASGGTSPYTSYLWSNAAPAQTTPTLSNVLAGTYTVTVTDSKGCTATTDTIIGGTPLPTAVISNFVPANCGFQNGSITVTAVSGTPQYTYLWAPSVQTTPTAAGVLAGTYTVTVTDAMGCTALASGTVPQLPGPTATAISTPDICSRGSGTATAMGAGGHGAPYSYFWNSGQTTQIAAGLHEGNITVIVSDGGCTATASVNVGNIPGPNAAFFANPKILTVMDGPVSFIDESNGSVINWDWTLGDASTSSITQFTHTYPDTGTYHVMEIITDTNGCKDTARCEIIVKDIYTFYVPNCFTPSGDSLNDWFYPQGINWDPTYFEMYIFDRWGNIMFRSLDITNKKWNGTFNNSGTKEDALMDVYVYLIRTKELNGPKHQYVGRVTLLK
jgi:gliding motility-associated-like protein